MEEDRPLRTALPRRWRVGQAYRKPVIGSRGHALHGSLPQPPHVAHGRRAEEPLVLAGELRDVAVAHAVAGASGVEALAEHEAAGLLQPELLLELQGLIAVTAR